MDEFEKKQIEKCLACKIGHDVINGYGEIYRDLFEPEQIKKKSDKETVENLIRMLKIQGDYKEKYARLKTLSKYDKTNNEAACELTCFIRLQPIITFLTPFFYCTDEIPNGKPYAKIIFSKMNELNNQHNDSYDINKGKEVIDKLYNKEYIKGHRKDIRQGLEDIYYTYIDIKTIKEKVNCNGEYFLNFIEVISQEYRRNQEINREFDHFCDRIKNLNNQFQAIIWEYINFAPKRFGDILDIVMKQQNMNETDVFHLTGIKPNAVQELQKNIEPTKREHDIFLIARALLVSENVLYCGIGQRYGNWNTLFRDEEIRNIQDNAELKCSNKTEAKKWLRKNIREIMDMEQKEFEELVRENTPDFFCTEDINLFPDRKSAYEELLDKKAVYTLVNVLERLETESEV